MNKKALIIPIILALAVLIAIILGAVLYFAKNRAKEGAEQPIVATTTPAVSENIDTSDWVLFDSQKDSGAVLNFTLKYPKNWISKGSIDGGIISSIPFYKKEMYSENCEKQKDGATECHMSGQIAHITITKKLEPNEIARKNTSDEYNIDGYSGYINSGINESGIINNQYISNKKIWVTVPDVKGFSFEFIMALENNNDKNIFYEIIKNIKFN